MKKSLTKQERLSVRQDINALFEQGIRLKSSGVSLVKRKNGLSMNRVLIAPVKSIGNSVERNYQKRLVREVYRHEKPYLKTGFDFGFILYPGNYQFNDRKNQVREVLSRANLYVQH